MEEAGVRPGEIEVGDIEEGIGARLVEERATTSLGDGHGIGVGRVGELGLVDLGSVDVVGIAISQNLSAVFIVSDEADGFEGESRAELGEILEDVVGPTAICGGFAADIGEHIFGRISIDHLDVIDDEISAGEESGAWGFGGWGLRHRSVVGIVWCGLG